ncbi:hypothetical protein CYMTET_20038, partial [Cymbomonas tetramitiformis]
VYNPDNVMVPPYFDRLQLDDSIDDLPLNTVPWAVAQMLRTVRQCDTQVKCIGPGKFEVAFALRMLIHFVGDLHQPLHCVDRFAPNLTKGDDGGNKVMVEVDGQTMSLHGYWDSAAGLLADNLTRPLNGASDDQIVQHAKAIMLLKTVQQEIGPENMSSSGLCHYLSSCASLNRAAPPATWRGLVWKGDTVKH